MTTACDRKVYQKGAVVLVTDTIPASQVEPWVRKIAQDSEQRVDWHFFAGRIVIKALGDLTRVRAALQKHLPEHDRLREAEIRKIMAPYGGRK